MSKNRTFTFTEKLNLLFESNDWKNKEVIAQTGISKSYLSQLRNGRETNPSLEMIEKLSDFFGVTPAYFLEEDGEKVLGVIDYLRKEDKIVRKIAYRARKLTPKGKNMAMNMFLDVLDYVLKMEADLLEKGVITDLDD